MSVERERGRELNCLQWRGGLRFDMYTMVKRQKVIDVICNNFVSYLLYSHQILLYTIVIFVLVRPQFTRFASIKSTNTHAAHPCPYSQCVHTLDTT